MLDAMLTLACEEALDREYAEAKAYAEANPVIPSEEFHKRMEKLIRSGTGRAAKTEKPQGGRILRVCKRTAVIIMILCTISFVTLMCSAAVRAEIARIASVYREIFSKQVAGEITAKEAADLNTDTQINQLESILAHQLTSVGMPSDTKFQIHIDGNLNLSIVGLDEVVPQNTLPFMDDTVFMTSIADTLSSAYASQDKNQIYYIQSVIRHSDAIASDPSEDLRQIKAEQRQIIRDYMLANNITNRNEIMNQTRIISYVEGKLIFDEGIQN